MAVCPPAGSAAGMTVGKKNSSVASSAIAASSVRVLLTLALMGAVAQTAAAAAGTRKNAFKNGVMKPVI